MALNCQNKVVARFAHIEFTHHKVGTDSQPSLMVFEVANYGLDAVKIKLFFLFKGDKIVPEMDVPVRVCHPEYTLFF